MEICYEFNAIIRAIIGVIILESREKFYYVYLSVGIYNINLHKLAVDLFNHSQSDYDYVYFHFQ